MQGRFLLWAGCTISDLKLTCSSAQGECPPARAPVESAGAEPTEKLLSASKKSSRIHAIIFFSRSLCIIRNWDTLIISIQQNLHNNHMSLTLGPYSCLQHPAVIFQLQIFHNWNRGQLWTLQAYIFQMNSELTTSAHSAEQGCRFVWFSQALEPHRPPDCTV